MFDLGGLLKKIDTFNIEGKLTDEERNELYTKARKAANVENSIDVISKLTELEQRVIKLENAGANDTVTGETTADEYVVGKWYYNGDKVTFEGTEYICIAPAGAVCTWSPAEYPAYWDKVSK